MSSVIPVLFQHHVRRRPHVRCHSRRRISVIDSPRSSIESHRRKALNGTHLLLFQHFVLCPCTYMYIYINFYYIIYKITLFVTNIHIFSKKADHKNDTFKFSFIWNLFVYFLLLFPSPGCTLVSTTVTVSHTYCHWVQSKHHRLWFSTKACSSYSTILI